MAKTKRARAARPGADGAVVSIGEWNKYKLVPAQAKTHYGPLRLHSGGVPYVYRSKKSDDAWLVESTINGRLLGMVQQWGDGDWTFSKVGPGMAPPRWLVDQQFGRDAPAIIHEADVRLISGSTVEEAIASGLGLNVGLASKKTPAELDREIAAMGK